MTVFLLSAHLISVISKNMIPAFDRFSLCKKISKTIVQQISLAFALPLSNFIILMEQFSLLSSSSVNIFGETFTINWIEEWFSAFSFSFCLKFSFFLFVCSLSKQAFPCPPSRLYIFTAVLLYLTGRSKSFANRKLRLKTHLSLQQKYSQETHCHFYFIFNQKPHKCWKVRVLLHMPLSPHLHP